MNPLSGVLGEAWQMYKAFARHLLTIAFVIYLIAAVVAALLGLVGGTIGTLLGSLVGIVAAYLLQATLVKAVQDVRDGRVDMSIGDTVRAATPYLAPVAGASILAGIAITIGLVLIIVPGLFLITIWAVIVPVIVLEGAGVFAAFGRSHELVRGRGWHVFGTLVLTWIILLVVNLVLGVIFSALPHALSNGLSSVISGTLVAPFIALVVTLVYYRLSGTADPVPPGASGYGDYQQMSLSSPGERRAACLAIRSSGRPLSSSARRPRRAGGGLRTARPGPRPPSAAPGAAPGPSAARPGRTAARHRP